MFAALALAQAAAVRASIDEPLVVQRFCVLSPSVSSTITLSLSGAGSLPWVNGSLLVNACQPHTSPIVTLVLPDACIASILELRLVKPVVSRMSVSVMIVVRPEHCAAGNLVWMSELGVVSVVSFGWSRSCTQPCHWACVM